MPTAQMRGFKTLRCPRLSLVLALFARPAYGKLPAWGSRSLLKYAGSGYVGNGGSGGYHRHYPTSGHIHYPNHGHSVHSHDPHSHYP